MISKIKEVIDDVSAFPNVPQDMVPFVVAHYLESLSNTLISPTHPSIRIPHFGLFYSSRSRIDHYLRRLIEKLRKNRTEINLQRFREAWKIRHAVYEYDRSRDFKSRFKSWHNNVKKLEWKN